MKLLIRQACADRSFLMPVSVSPAKNSSAFTPPRTQSAFGNIVFFRPESLFPEYTSRRCLGIMQHATSYHIWCTWIWATGNWRMCIIIC